VQALEGASLTDGVERLEVLHVVRDHHSLLSLHNRLERHDLSGELGGLADLVRGGLSLPWLLGVEWEEDELALVLLETLGVLLEGLHGLVHSPVVHGDTDGLGFLLADTSSLELLKSESTAGPLLEVVLVSGAPDHGVQALHWAGSHASSLGHTVVLPPDFPGWLVEPSSPHPV